MALRWELITEDVINISSILNDLLDTINEKDVSWVVRLQDGSIDYKKVPNLAKLTNTIKANLNFVDFMEVDDTDVLYINTYNVIKTNDKDKTVYLPENPTDGTSLALTDGSYNAENHPVTIKRTDDSKLNNSDDDLICDVSGFLVFLYYSKDDNSWYLINK